MADGNAASAIMFDNVETPAQDLRTGLTALMANGTGRSLGTRGGRRPGTAGIPTVSGLTVTIPPGSAITDPAYNTTQGPYPVSWRQAQTVTLAPAPGSNSRIDLVYVRVFDNIFDAQGNGRTIQFGKVTGTPSATPDPPTVLSDGTTPVSRVTILAYVTVPSSGAATVTPGPSAVAAGGIMPVDENTGYPVGMEDGSVTWNTRLNELVVKIAGTWTKRDTRPMPTIQAGTSTVLTRGDNGIGQITFPGGSFGATPVVIAVPGGGGGGLSSIIVTSANGSLFSFVARNNNGVVMLNANVTVNWLALVTP